MHDPDRMFSVVVPVFNHAKFLPQAISSALRAPLVEEIFLLDDGSTDGSASVASRLAAANPDRVRDVTPPGGINRGAHQRLNELIELARSEWVAVLNSDDIFVAGRFEAIVADAQFRESDFFFGNVLFMNEHGALTGSKRAAGEISLLGAAGPRLVRDRLLDLLARENYLISTSNMVFRKNLHARIGGFSPYRYVHDWDFALRAMAVGRPRHLDTFLTAYRRHPANTILESFDRPRREVKQIFDRFGQDFPELSSRPEFRAGQQRLFHDLELDGAASQAAHGQ